MIKLVEPSAINCASENYNISLHKALNWYNYEKDKKAGHAFLRNYIIGKHGRSPLKVYDRIPLQNIVATYMWLAQLKNNGSVLSDTHQQNLDSYVDNLIAVESSKIVEEIIPPTTPKASIQDLMLEKSKEIIGMLEGEFDKVVFNGEEIDLYKFLQANSIPQAYNQYIESWIKEKQSEFTFIQNSDDEQIKEGYSHITKRRMSKIISQLSEWIKSLENYSNFKKANKKPRAKKEKPPGQQVAKLSFKKEDQELNLKSITPTEIVGASQVWIYNTKTKKLAAYRSDSARGIQVKGTTLQNYDPDLSEQKTLRKPAETIKQVLSGGKIQLRKILTNLSTKNNPVNGRINEECILLRAIK